MQLICKCGQKFDDKSGWQSGSGLVCGDCYQKSRSHIIMSGFGNQWYRADCINSLTNPLQLTKDYQIVEERVTYGPNEPTVFTRITRPLKNKPVPEELVKLLSKEDEDKNEILNKDNTKRHRKRRK